MDEDSGYEVIDDEELVHQILDDEELVPQILDDHDTVPMPMPAELRASTSSEWPPQPPMPGDIELAIGTLTDGVPPPRTAQIFEAVRRPTTSSDEGD